MAHDLKKSGMLRLKLGESLVTLSYRQPAPAEVIEAMVRKLPRGDEDADAHALLSANLELGQACLAGVGEGELSIDGAPLSSTPGLPGYRSDWAEVVAERAPLLLVALGQWLSAPPAFVEERSLKKSSGMPGPSAREGS